MCSNQHGLNVYLLQCFKADYTEDKVKTVTTTHCSSLHYLSSRQTQRRTKAFSQPGRAVDVRTTNKRTVNKSEWPWFSLWKWAALGQVSVRLWSKISTHTHTHTCWVLPWHNVFTEWEPLLSWICLLSLLLLLKQQGVCFTQSSSIYLPDG